MQRRAGTHGATCHNHEGAAAMALVGGQTRPAEHSRSIDWPWTFAWADVNGHGMDVDGGRGDVACAFGACALPLARAERKKE